MNKLVNWFYTTKLGEIYFDILLWLDRKFDKPNYLDGKQVTQIIREYSLLSEGVTSIKRNVNELVRAKSKEEYDTILKSIEDLTKYAERDANSPQASFVKVLRDTYVKRGSKDIETALDHAKMIESRIEDYKELQAYNEKRQLQKKIREAAKLGNTLEENKLKEEWNKRYGRIGK